jgi:two-component system response regulator RegA
MRILIVDDDEPFRLALRNAFLRRGYEVSLAGSPAEVDVALRDGLPQYAVVDLRMPGGGSGLDVVKALRALPKAPQVVVLTGYGTIGSAVEAVRLGAINYLNKPADAEEIEAALQGKRAPPADDVPSLDRTKWEYLNRILADCDGNISEAARRLKMHRRTLQRMLQKHPPKA